MWASISSQEATAGVGDWAGSDAGGFGGGRAGGLL